MFYEESTVKDILICKKCRNYYDDARLLPCGESACNICIKNIQIQNGTFECPICESRHFKPHEEFPLNKAIQDMLKLKPVEISRGDAFETLKQNLNELRKLTDSFAFKLEHAVDLIKEYCIDLRTDVELSTEIIIQQIIEANKIILNNVNLYESQCISEYENDNIIKTKFQKLHLKCKNYCETISEILKQPQITDDVVLFSNRTAKELIKDLEDETNNFDKFIFDGDKLKFKRNNVVLDTSMLGELSFVKRIQSTILNREKLNDLLNLCGFSEYQKWRLIYRASRDTFSINKIHANCGGKGKYLTIIMSTNGNIFGGYNEVEWPTNNSYKSDPGAFLFSLVNKENNPIVIKCSPHKSAIGFHSNFGLIFGNIKHWDLAIGDNSNEIISSRSYLGSSYRHPYYECGSEEAKSFLAGSHQFKTLDIEIFCKC